MKAQHTPGPWTVHAQASANNYVALVDNNWMAAIQFNGELMVAKQDANAALIAAAPDLLEALKESYKYISGGSEAQHGLAFQALFDQVRAAIFKATGEEE